MSEPGAPREISEDAEPGRTPAFAMREVSDDGIPESGPPFRTRRYDPRWHLDVTRRWLAIGIIGVAVLTTAGTIIAHVAGAMDTATFSSTMSGLSGLQALAAAVVGFYFGANKSD